MEIFLLYNMKRDFDNQKDRVLSRGFALISVVLILGVLLLIGTAFFTLVTFERKISLSQESSFETYYLAEAGISEVIYKLRNDDVWREEFEEGTIDRTITREGGIVENSSYEVSIVSTDTGEAEAISVGKLDRQGVTAQRIIKTKIVKATNPNPLADITTFSDGDITLYTSGVTVHNGHFFSNDDIELNGWSLLDILNGKAMAVDEVNVSTWSTLNASEGCEAAVCAADCNPCNPPPPFVDIPILDFDSSDENSYKSKAGAVYSEEEFADLLENNNPLVIDRDVTYVEGDIRIKRDQRLILSGLLVADGNIVVGKGGGFPSFTPCLEINHIVGKGSGLLSKGSIEFLILPWSSDVNIEGVLYAMDNVIIKNLGFGQEFNLVGSVISRQIDFYNFFGNIYLSYDEDIQVKSFFGPPADGPVVTIEHWEEEY